MYRKVEGILYNHYKRKKRVSSLKSRLARTENRIRLLRKDIKECNVDLEDTMKAIDYSKDSVQSGSVTSNIERELEKVVDKLLRETSYSIKQKYKIKSKINNLEKEIENIEILLSELPDIELQIIELKYGEGKSYKVMENLIHMGKSTIQRKHQEVMNYLIEEIR